MFDVYNELGNVWLEETYERALKISLEKKGLKVLQQFEYEVLYKKTRLGVYRPDLVVNDTVIIELKIVDELNRLHRAQLISYLKGFQKPIGILANFGGHKFEREIIPNKYDYEKVLIDGFKISELGIELNDNLTKIYEIANEILVTLGPGFYAKIYHKAFFEELLKHRVSFEMKNKITANYEGEIVGERWVNFFQLFGNMLVSVVAIQQITPQLITRFRNYLKLLNLKEGIVFNFSKLVLEHKYIKIKL